MNYKIDTKNDLEKFVTSQWDRINQFIDQKTANLPIPFYSSVDIRESKTKYAPVDHNMYPAGFNNLCQLDLDASGPLFREAIEKVVKGAKRIAIIPEAHTKNIFYLDHLAYLGKTLMNEGYQVCYVSLDTNLFQNEENNISLISHSKFDIVIEKAEIKDGLLMANNQTCDLAILNNDQSSPLDIDWQSVKTPIVPTPLIGWFNRQKVNHFKFYDEVVKQVSEEFSIRPCLIQALFTEKKDVDFSTKEGLEGLGAEVDSLIGKLPEGSKVFVKASQGTYGMGISVIGSGDEIISMNRKNRDKMNIGKNKIKFTTLLIQEGVDSVLEYDGMAAEIAIYLVNGRAVGGFVRANAEKDAGSNLNSKGMVFKKYCISEIRQNRDHQAKEALYSIIARLATWASAYEIREVI